MTREDFERAFHSRTVAYQPAYRADTRPVVVEVGEDAHTPIGHALLVALVNQLARAHQHIAVVGAGHGALLCRHVFGFETLQEATLGLATAINPFIVAASGTSSTEPLVTLGVGSTRGEVDLRIGCQGWHATFGPDTRINDNPTSLLGAMLAACIAASYTFHRLLGHPSTPADKYSLWDFGSVGGAQGPAFTGSVDVGRVLQAGAGGVGASLDFWLGLLGISGRWTIADGDFVEPSNLNRQLAFLAKHAGFPDPPASNKAVAAATLLGKAADPQALWYDDPRVAMAEYDLVLALANERGVRSALQMRQPPVLLHATTSSNWEAQFHRHIADRDDCINCRIPGAPPRLACAQAEVGTGTSTDAALPFLSATAGLLLLVGLVRLQLDQLAGDRNFVSLYMGTGSPIPQQLVRACHGGCSGWAAPEVRRVVARHSRFARLDPASAAAD